jgi:hypothetical protein
VAKKKKRRVPKKTRRGARRPSSQRKLSKSGAARKTIRRAKVKRPRNVKRQRARAILMPPRQVAVRAQETAFQLLVAVDRGGIIHRFLRWYANEGKRPGRIANPGRYRELVETIRRESFIVLALQVEADAQQRLGARPRQKTSLAQGQLQDLFREEFCVALGRSLDFSDEEFNEFCRDIEVYRELLKNKRSVSSSANAFSAPAGPFVDRCGFLLDSPMLDQGRRAAAKFEAELHATASAVLKKVFSRRSYF